MTFLRYEPIRDNQPFIDVDYNAHSEGSIKNTTIYYKTYIYTYVYFSLFFFSLFLNDTCDIRAR